MSGAPFDGVDVAPPEDGYGDGGSPGGVRGDHLPLGDVVHDKDTVPLLFHAYDLIEADVLHQLVQMPVVVADLGLVGCFVVVFLQYPVGGLGVDRELVDVHHGDVPGLLLDDLEDVPVEAVPVDPDHIGVPHGL